MNLCPVTCLSQAWRSLVLPGGGPGDTPSCSAASTPKGTFRPKKQSFQEQYWLPEGLGPSICLSQFLFLCVCTCLCVWMTVWVCVCVCTAHVCMQRVLSLLKRMGLLWSRMGLGEEHVMEVRIWQVLIWRTVCIMNIPVEFSFDIPSLSIRSMRLNLPTAALTYLKAFCFQNSQWSC